MRLPQARRRQRLLQLASSLQLARLVKRAAAMNRGANTNRCIQPAPRSNRNDRADCASCEPLPKPAQEIFALAHEAFVSGLHAMNETNYLRHDQRKQRQR